MKIKVVSENNFFLFQDIVYFFIKTLEGNYFSFPIKNKHTDYKTFKITASSYIYDSWLEVLKEKLHKSELTEKGKKIVSKFSSWMITTNIAIITAQIGRGREDIPSCEMELIQKYKPTFLIEHFDNYETYIIHLDGENEELFLESIKFYMSFTNMDSEVIINELLSLYKVDKTDIQEEINVLSNHFITEFKYINCYEVLED